MTQLSRAQQDLHQSAVVLCQHHRKIEARLVEALREIDRCKLYKLMGCPSLFNYAVELLKLSESVAYAFISVARKTNEISALKSAIQDQKLSVAKASRMVSVLTSENSARLVEFAIQHSTRELEREVARINPKASVPDRAKAISESVMKLELSMSTVVYKRLQRAQDILASKIGKNAGFEQTIDLALSEYLDRHDPVKRAERAMVRKTTVRKNANMEADTDGNSGNMNSAIADSWSTEANSDSDTCTSKIPSKFCARRARNPLTAGQKHLVAARGGSNEPQNLTTLCSYHHDLVHQLSLPLEGQVTWLRARVVLYGVDPVSSVFDSHAAG